MDKLSDDDIAILKSIVIKLTRTMEESSEESDVIKDVEYWKSKCLQVEFKWNSAANHVVKDLNKIVRGSRNGVVRSLKRHSDLKPKRNRGARSNSAEDSLITLDEVSSPLMKRSETLSAVKDMRKMESVTVGTVGTVGTEKKKKSNAYQRRMSIGDLTSSLINFTTEPFTKPASARKSFFSFEEKCCSFTGEFINSSVTVYDFGFSLSHLDERDEEIIGFIPQSEHAFFVEPYEEEWDIHNFKLHFVPDVYKSSYIGQDHKNYIANNGNGTTFILSVVEDTESDIPGSYKCLSTRKEGFIEYSIRTDNDKVNFEKFFELEFEGFSITEIKEPDFQGDILNIESKHRQRQTKGRVGVIMVKKDQTDPLEMFANDATDELNEFLQIMDVDTALFDIESEESVQVQTTWKIITLNWHVAPYECGEEHRRLIGNDACIIFFLERDVETFNIELIDNLGVVPQFYMIVQPHGEKYKLQSFSKKLIRPFHPKIPKNYLFSKEEIRDFLMVKISNGYMMTLYCPPMNRLFVEPRKSTINDISLNYKTKRKKKDTSRSKSRKAKIRKSSKVQVE